MPFEFWSKRSSRIGSRQAKHVYKRLEILNEDSKDNEPSTVYLSGIDRGDHIYYEGNDMYWSYQRLCLIDEGKLMSRGMS